MADPRFDGQRDMKAVVKNPGWYVLEHVNEISGGTSYTDDMPGREKDSRWLEFYANQTIHSASPHLARFYLKISGTGAESMEGSAVRAETYLDVTSGNVLSGQAVHAETKIGATLGNMVGYVTALRGILTIDAATRTFSGGVFCAAYLTSNIATGNTVAARTSFIAFEDSGAVTTSYLIDTASIADGKCWTADSGAVGTVLGYYTINTASGAGYLVVYANHS